MPIIECVPNISEGTRPDVVASIANALRAVPGLRVLDVQSDATHNRSVLTLAGDAAAMRAGIPVLFGEAVKAIDCGPTAASTRAWAPWTWSHSSRSPASPSAECVALAREIGEDVAARLKSRSSSTRKPAPTPRARTWKTSAAASSRAWRRRWRSRLGARLRACRPHASAGASVIGARMPLIAYNINLATDRLDVAKKIATAIRMSSGGLRFVKAMGIALEDRASCRCR